MVIGPVMRAWPPFEDVQEPDTSAKPKVMTNAVTAAVQNLFTKGTPSQCYVTPPVRSA
jgi:hypothetical protein